MLQQNALKNEKTLKMLNKIIYICICYKNTIGSFIFMLQDLVYEFTNHHTT